MREGIALIAFTDCGETLGRKLAEALDASLTCRRDQRLGEWTQKQFSEREALVFIGAAGIAVRAIAPWVRNKAEDPAVVCVDETGRWAIPLLSGHLGGANALAQRIAGLCGGEAVITTATDLHRVFAVDLWAKKQGLAVLQPERIKNISAKLLRGEEIVIGCPFPIAGKAPGGIRLGSEGDVCVSVRERADAELQLVPRILTLGIGCRQGTTVSQLDDAFACFREQRGFLPQAVEQAASIDLKKDEEGLLRFCADHGWALRLYTAGELREVKGSYSASEFVRKTVGVDNVCERAACLCSGGEVMERKFAMNGVTFALAARQPGFDWSW